MKTILGFMLEDPVGQNIFVIAINVILQTYLVVFNAPMTMVQLIQNHFLMVIMINVITLRKWDL